MVRLEQITKSFAGKTLFQGLSWSISRGARLGLVGPNGVGKTTLLRILCGSEPPDAGAVHRPSALRVGYLPQEVETVSGGSVLAAVLEGFAELAELEERVATLERRLARTGPRDPETAELTRRYGELRHRFEALGGDRLESRASRILGGLGVPSERFHDPLDTLSGGWRMRVLLARLLLSAPGLLLLDEPTNHLDLDALDWLEGFLEAYEGAFIVVSHDRFFLNRMVRAVVELERGRLDVYPGNYDEYLAAKEERRSQAEKAARHQAVERAKVERFIERFRYKNTKARQVQSRIRSLAKVRRVELPPTARRVRFGFPAAPRSGDVVVRLRGVAKRYGEHVVYDGLDLILRRGDRVALVGPNGSGKSTLLKLLSGRTPVDAGRLELGHNVHAQYYAQHQLEALEPERTVIEEAESVAEPGERPRLRKLLGCFLFTGEDVEQRVATLSGGEKARLALAKMLIRPANLLLLDEPTNHLDLRSREVLEEALNEYGGSLVLVSHDRYFINRVATSVAEVGGGRLAIHPGDYDAFVESRRNGRAAVAAAENLPADARDDRREERRRAAEARNLRYRRRRAVEARLEPIEARVAELEGRVRELERLQADPQVYSDPQRAAEVGRDRGNAERKLERLYAEWERVAAELEGS